MKRLTLASFCLLFLAGCATTRTPSRQETAPPPKAQEPMFSQAGGFYRSTKSDEHALVVEGKAMVLSGATVTKEGGNAAVFIDRQGSLTISRSQITTNGNGADAILAQAGAKVHASDMQCITQGDGSAVMVNDHAVLDVKGGTFLSQGTDSPVLRNQGTTSISRAMLTSSHAPVICMGEGTLSIQRGSIKAENGPVIQMEGKPMEISLDHVAVTSGEELFAIDGGDTVVTMTVTQQDLEGTITVHGGATLNLILKDHSTYRGLVKVAEGCAAHISVDETSTFLTEEGSSPTTITPL